jgi:chemotaxis protein methyltransferase CheR
MEWDPMPLPSAKQTMTPQDFKALRDFIYSKCGIYFSDSKQYFLENRLGRRLAELGIPSYQAYFERLQSSQGREEMRQLFNEVTTNETSFWRNPPQIEAFQKAVLPEVAKLARARGTTRVRIWSAACSSGEEPYTLAMVCMDERDLSLRGLSVEILATDISDKVLALAQEGQYGAYTLRNLTPQQMGRYFMDRGSDTFEVIPDLRKLVQFRNANLVDYATYKSLGTFDVIFCRNVLIYFDETVKVQVLKGFHEQLNPNAYLMVGHSESIHAFGGGFELLHFSKAMGYRKRP